MTESVPADATGDIPSLDPVWRHFVHLTGSLPIFAYLKDAQQRFLYVNSTFARAALGVEPRMVATLLHRRHSELLADRSDEQAAWMEEERREQRVLATGHPADFDEQQLLAHGRMGHLVGTRCPVRTVHGLVLAVLAVDLTASAQAQDLVDELQFKYQGLFDNAGVAIVSLSADGAIEDANAAACQLLSQPPSSLTDTPLLDFVHPQDRARVAELEQTLDSSPQERYQTNATVLDSHGVGTDVRVTRILRTPSAPLAEPVSLATIETIDAAAPALSGQRPTSDDENSLKPEASSVCTDELDLRILLAAAAGASTAQISVEVLASTKNVEYRLRRLRRRMQVPTTTALVARAYVLGLLDSQTWPPSARAPHVTAASPGA